VTEAVNRSTKASVASEKRPPQSLDAGFAAESEEESFLLMVSLAAEWMKGRGAGGIFPI
jgi:hypothetical protein